MESENRTLRRSWMGRVFPYVGLLEELVGDLKRERDELMSRLMKLTTGYGMQERIPTQEEILRNQEMKQRPRTVPDLMRHLEKESLESYLKKPAKPNGEESGDNAKANPTTD